MKLLDQLPPLKQTEYRLCGASPGGSSDSERLRFRRFPRASPAVWEAC